jgi:hypothetical protein
MVGVTETNKTTADVEKGTPQYKRHFQPKMS